MHTATSNAIPSAARRPVLVALQLRHGKVVGVALVVGFLFGFGGRLRSVVAAWSGADHE
jgi:hypothetical protein